MPWFWRKQPRPAPVSRGPLGKPALSEQEVVGAALLSPRFCDDLTVWQLTIHQGGLLRQKIRTVNFENTVRCELRHEETKIPIEELDTILAAAEHVGFRHYQDNYDDCGVSDQEDLWLAIRYPDGLKAVQAYAPFLVAARSKDPEMLGFLELWGRIHRFAPFASHYNQVERMLQAHEEFEALLVKAREADSRGIASRASDLLRRLLRRRRD
jgi:hypothetical protein